MIKDSGQGTARSRSNGPFALFPPYTLAEESVLMEPDGSQMTPEDSEDMDWLEQFPGPQSSPGTDLSGLDLDGRRTKQVSRSQCQGSGKSKLIEQMGWGTVVGVRENCGDEGEGVGTNNSRVPLHLSKYWSTPGLSPGLLFSVCVHFLTDLVQTHGFGYHLYRQFPVLYF